MAQNAWTGLSQSTAHLPALGMGMMQMKENQSNKDAALGLAAERNALAQQHEARMEEQARLQTEAARANIPQHRKVFNPSLVPQVSVATEKQYGKHGLAAFQPMLDTVKEVGMANPESTFGDVYEAAKSAYPAHREEMMGSIEKALASGKLNPIEQKRLSALYDAIAYDKTGDRVLGEGVFKNTARSMKMEEENSKAALQAERIASLEQRTADRIASSERNTDARIKAAEDRAAGKGGGTDKATDKDVKTKIAEVNTYIRKTQANREKWVKAYDKADPNSEYAKNAMAEIEKFDEQLGIAEDTLAGLQNGDIDPKTVKSGGSAKAQPASGAPKIGEVRKGYKFKGGDPADQNSWEKV